MPKSTATPAKPFLKWAGGKTQLLKVFEDYYPPELADGKLTKYVEPFVGSGAVMFDLIQRPDTRFEEIHIFDVNPELINVYKVIQHQVDALIEALAPMQETFFRYDREGQKKVYYGVRDTFNRRQEEIRPLFDRINSIDYQTGTEEVKRLTLRAAQLIFLNKTCYNGLFRVNRYGQFNVPMGEYKKPSILNEENLRSVSRLLKERQVNIVCGQYKQAAEVIDKDSFVYFDPPYRPLNQTSSFTSYSKDSFSDDDQKELAGFFLHLHQKHRGDRVFLMLSNSDPFNVDPQDDFFYRHYLRDDVRDEIFIHHIYAKRSINSKGDKRGEITELLITNYPVTRKEGATQ